MTDAIQPIGAAGASDQRLPPPVEAAGPAQTAPATRLEVSRASEAPVYVYRVLDNDTGRTLVEIPRRGADFKEERSGGLIDTKA